MSAAREEICPFCQCMAEKRVVVEHGSMFAVRDKHPVVVGHHLVISKRHVADYFAMSYNDKTRCRSVARTPEKTDPRG